MAEQQAQSNQGEAQEVSLLDSILDKVDAQKPVQDAKEKTAEQGRGEIVLGGLKYLLNAVVKQEDKVEQIDEELLDSFIGEIDRQIGLQVDEIIHNEKFQQLEAAWKGLRYLVDRSDSSKGVIIDVLDVSKNQLQQSFKGVPLIQSDFYEKVHDRAYDQAGADPYSAIVTNYEFDRSAGDMKLLTNLSKVSAACHAPMIGSIGYEFFGKDSMESFLKIPDLKAHMKLEEYTLWNAFRKTPDSRYVGLTFPRFLLREPYGPDSPETTRSFQYIENTYDEAAGGLNHEKYLWGNSSFAFAANLTRAFVDDGWAVQIRGAQSGGKVSDLPVAFYDIGKGKEMKIPTEIGINDTLEMKCSDLGLISLVHYENTNQAVFFSANSVQEYEVYPDDVATANSRINATAPIYLFGFSHCSLP